MPEPQKPRAAAAEPAKAPAPPAALARFLDEARAFEPEQVVPFRTDARMVQHAVGLGVAAVLEWTDHVREHLPHVDLAELRSLPDLALCLAHAAQEVDGGGPEVAEARELLVEAHALRRPLKAAAQALVAAGTLTPRDLAKVGGEHGAVDAGGDCLALAALFEKRGEEIAGQTPITDEDRARAAEVGNALKAFFKPKAAAKKPGPHGLSLVEARDRLWTLLVHRHERLWAVGAYVYGHAVDEHVPPIAAPPASAKLKRPKTEET
jgi:hypothetical protein